jgi:para-nitrobenzyl esterase
MNRIETARAVILTLLAAAALAASPDEVKIDTGALRGKTADGVAAYKGIPFAAPPTGERRWRAPQPVQPWKGVRSAESYGPDCAQEPFPGDAAPLGGPNAEDCLYVNVWTPAQSGRGKLPVMVWFYGGGFVNGGSSPSVYDGTQFAKRSVVMVSFNYRLGHFGFFAHPALAAEQKEGPLGNYAFMDQIAALKWVRRNIAAFGGDPNNVTIFGESAGGMSVHVMMTSPLAKGLFHKAIVQSGGGRPGLLGNRTLSGGTDSAEAKGIAFAKKFGIEGTDAAALAKMRAIPAEQISKGLHMMVMGMDPTYVGGPIRDDTFVPGAPSELYAAGKGARVPVMIGATNADIGFARGTTVDEVFATFGPDADEARSLYNPENSTDVGLVALRVGGDQTMVEPVRHVARILSARGQKVYAFRFSYVAESLRKQWPGAMHATEIPFVFDTVAARYGKDLTEADANAARVAHEYWIEFARSGTPSAPGQPEWPAYEEKADRIMDFTNTGPVLAADPWRARLDLAEAVSTAAERDAGKMP